MNRYGDLPPAAKTAVGVVMFVLLWGAGSLCAHAYYAVATPPNEKLSRDVTAKYAARLARAKVRLIDSEMKYENGEYIPGLRYVPADSWVPDWIKGETVCQGAARSIHYRRRDYWIEVAADGEATVRYKPFGGAAYEGARDRILQDVGTLLDAVEDREAYRASAAATWR